MKKILIILGLNSLALLFSYPSTGVFFNENRLNQQNGFDCINPSVFAKYCEILQAQNQALENQAQQLYQQDQYHQSLIILQQLLEEYQAENNHLGIVRVLRNQSLIYLRQKKLTETEKAISSSLNLLNTIQKKPDQLKIYASVLEVKGQLELLQNQPKQALNTWQESAQIYQQLNQIKSWTRTQINQTQALQALGLYSKALKKLIAAERQLSFEADSLLKAKSLQSLGDVLREIGDLKLSNSILKQSLTIAENFQDSEETGIILLSLGKTATLENKWDAAYDFYQQVVQGNANLDLQVQAKINQLDLLIQQEKKINAMQLIDQIENQLYQLSDSPIQVAAQIHFAKSLMQFHRQGNQTVSVTKIAQHLLSAIQTARLLENKRHESYGMGILGGLYQYNQQWQDAQFLTEQALQIAQSINADDIAYQWQWQLGQILNAQYQPKQAIKAYTQAWKSLKSIRGDIVAINSEVQFDFRKQVEPVYRELVDLLLSSQPTQQELKQAMAVIESLQLAELDNFFRNACLDMQPMNIDQIDPTAAILYTINLSDRIEMIVSMNNQPLTHYTISLNKSKLETLISQMQTAMTLPNQRIFIENYLEPSGELYDYLIRPLESSLEKNNIQTLVFILDVGLWNISLASLFDGQQYLIEKYNLVMTPGLKLMNPQPLIKNQFEVLAAGMTEARQKFPPLPSVELELAQIQASIKSQILFNEKFTEPRFNQTVNQTPFSIVHLATHGEFSSKLEDTFLLTWNEKINIEKLRDLLQADSQQLNPIELLVLSACQTAVGDDRAGLGLAGVAVRSGARSTLASLWSVNDQSTALLMSHFYQALKNPQLTKAEALRYAQLKVLKQQKFAHPFFWSGFVLVGNWL